MRGRRGPPRLRRPLIEVGTVVPMGSGGSFVTAGRRCAIAAACALAVLGSFAGPALAAFPQDPPNDPGYGAEGSLLAENCISGQQYELFDFIPSCAPLARDPEGASGMSVNRVWREYTTGDPDVVIAYVEA